MLRIPVASFMASSNSFPVSEMNPIAVLAASPDQVDDFSGCATWSANTLFARPSFPIISVHSATLACILSVGA
jgi:hypothetical protein